MTTWMFVQQLIQAVYKKVDSPHKGPTMGKGTSIAAIVRSVNNAESDVSMPCSGSSKFHTEWLHNKRWTMEGVKNSLIQSQIESPDVTFNINDVSHVPCSDWSLIPLCWRRCHILSAATSLSPALPVRGHNTVIQSTKGHQVTSSLECPFPYEDASVWQARRATQAYSGAR